MTRRYEYPVTVRIGDGGPADAVAWIKTALRWPDLVTQVEVVVGEPVDITPKSAADRAEDAIRRVAVPFDAYAAVVTALIPAVRAAVGEDAP